MTYATIDELRSNLGTPAKASAVHSPEYVEKMMHRIPAATSVDRTVFLLQQVAGKRVLEFGASGPMHDGIVKAAASVSGVDRVDAPGVVGFDLDDVSQLTLPLWQHEPDVIVCGEVIEHLSNPGWFLMRLKRTYPGVPVVITVPNAFTSVGRAHLANSVENVNRDHVAWYSWKTLSALLERVGYRIREFYWYGGNGPTAQGLVVVAE